MCNTIDYNLCNRVQYIGFSIIGIMSTLQGSHRVWKTGVKNNGQGKVGVFYFGPKAREFLYFRPVVWVFFPEWLNAAISIK